jgi:hypothetical protein
LSVATAAALLFYKLSVDDTQKATIVKIMGRKFLLLSLKRYFTLEAA